MLASIIIRTLNEARRLGEVLDGIAQQETNGLDWEVIIVDSGSTDGTLEIASGHGCRIRHIAREEFSFGRSLNRGCGAAEGDLLVLISGHCVPRDKSWLEALCQPLIDGAAAYTYGRQLGGPESCYSECRIFAKFYPDESRVPQEGFFCNNANAALTRQAWDQFRFDEELTGLEDMDFALRLTKRGGKIAYVAEAAVIHYHEEEWKSVRLRFEREALALRYIMPHVHIRKRDLLRYIGSSIWMDWRSAWRDKVSMSKTWEIVMYRLCQYWGSFKGNHEQRMLSHADKEIYFYPSMKPSLSNPSQVNDSTLEVSPLSPEVGDSDMELVQVRQREIRFVVPSDRFRNEG